MLVIECGGGAVLLADGVDPAGITELAGVSRADVRGEDIGPLRPAVATASPSFLAISILMS